MPRRAPARATLAAPRLALATLAAVVSALAPARAHAVKLTLQGGGTASAGWTDNILNAADEPTVINGTPGPTRQSDVFFQLVPRLVLTSASPKFMERLAYAFTADLFARHSEANSYSNTLEWTGNLALTPNVTMIFTLQSVQGRISTFTINQGSSSASIGVLPQNSDTNYFSQNAAERLEATPRFAWRVSQGLRFSAFVPIDRGKLADAYQLVGDLGFDHIFKVDALGLVSRIEFADFVAPRDPTTDVATGPDQQQVLTSLVGRWRHDWSPSWSTEAALGGMFIAAGSSDPSVATVTAWKPNALAALRWFRDLGSAELRYAHDVSVNALAGLTFETDGVSLQAGFPVVRAKMYFGATAGYQHARDLALVAGRPSATAEVVLADATIGWQPRPEVGVFARYAFFDQFGSPPDATGKPALLPDLTRHTVMLGVTVLYPAVQGTRVATRPGTRVDSADQPDFPEVHAPQPTK